ncbi:unnamed protein product, partial [marine sediment metagenome]
NFKIEKAYYTFGPFGALAYEILFLAQTNVFVYLIILPFFFVFIYPFLLILMAMDKFTKYNMGNGLQIIAKKNSMKE